MTGPTARRFSLPTRWLLSGGALAGPLFVGGFLLEGVQRPGYQHRRHPVSSLALGPGGWRQALSFAVSGGLCLGFAAGLGQVADGRLGPGARLIGAAGAGLIGTGLFVTDPFNGYPVGTPDTPDSVSMTGQLHDLSAAVILVSLPAAQLLHARRFARVGSRGWAAYSAATAITMITGAALSRAGFAQLPKFVANAGLYQKVAVVAGFGWGTALALRSLRTSS
jgi:uncharacterized protein DUF998